MLDPQVSLPLCPAADLTPKGFSQAQLQAEFSCLIICIENHGALGPARSLGFVYFNIWTLWPWFALFPWWWFPPHGFSIPKYPFAPWNRLCMVLVALAGAFLLSWRVTHEDPCLCTPKASSSSLHLASLQGGRSESLVASPCLTDIHSPETFQATVR